MRARPAVLSLSLSLLLAGGPAGGQPDGEAPPKVFELLDQVRKAYAALPSYRDHGEIETVPAPAIAPGAPAPAGVPPRRFETVARAGGAFRFVLETGEGLDARRQVIWGDARRGAHYDSGRGAVKPITSWLAELVTLLGEGSLDALLVPALLAGGSEVLPDPAAASVEGPVPCAEASCWIVAMSPFGGGVEQRLWVDRRSHLIRRVEVRPAAGEAGEGMLPGLAARPALVRVVHHLDAVASPMAEVTEADLAFALPAGAARVSRFREEGAAAPIRAAGPGGEPAFGEVVNVQLFSLTVRVIDDAGNPVRGLTPADFRVRLDGAEIPVAAADWFSSESPASPQEAPAAAAAPGEPGQPSDTARALPSMPDIWPPEPPLPDEGQLVVFFVQADINAPSRTRGHLKTLPYARNLLDTLKPADRAAVVSFDSHLKLWQDFTRDREAVSAAIGRAIRFGGSPEPATGARGEAQSLSRHFDAGAAKAAASPEQALEVVGRALAPLPGAKVMIYLGWGMGTYVGGLGVRATRDYGPALRSLDAARATVFVLDITDAASHSLEVGLEGVAEATGGTYAKTVDFPAQAAGRLARVISGHYVLSVDAARLAGGGKLSVELKSGKGRVLHRTVTIL